MTYTKATTASFSQRIAGLLSALIIGLLLSACQMPSYSPPGGSSGPSGSSGGGGGAQAVAVPGWVPVVAALVVVAFAVVECPVVECPVVECPAAVSLKNSPAGNLETLREQMAVAQREAPETDSLLKIWIRLWMTHSTALMMLWVAPAKVPAK